MACRSSFQPVLSFPKPSSTPWVPVVSTCLNASNPNPSESFEKTWNYVELQHSCLALQVHTAPLYSHAMKTIRSLHRQPQVQCTVRMITQ